MPDILGFIRRNYTTWDHNKRRLQGLTSDVCGKYCYLFVLYMDRGYTLQQFIALFDAFNADRQVEGMFTAEFGAEMPRGGWVQCCRSYISILIIPNLSNREAVIEYEFLRGRQNEKVIKELCVASAAASVTFRFKPSYKMADEGSTESDINLSTGI